MAWNGLKRFGTLGGPVNNRHKKKLGARNASLSYLQCLKSYFDDTLLHGYRYVSKQGKNIYERGLWLSILMAMIASMTYVVTDYYLRFINAPTATSQQAMRIPISEIPFPAVVVCPAARLNKTAVYNLAQEIFDFQSKRQFTAKNSVAEIVDELTFFGGFYTMDVELNDFYVIDQLHNVLQDMHNGSYDVEALVDMLTPDCLQYLNNCRFGATPHNCSTLFTRRKTEMGKCCAFNMNRPTEKEFWNGKIYNRSDQLYIKNAGQEAGLTLEIDPHLHDFMYVLQSNMAVRVFILEPHNYPTEDQQPVVMMPNMEIFLSIIPRRVTGDRTMLDIDAESRGCYFFAEPNLVYSNFYSLQECNTVCKVKDIISYCGCTPVQYNNFFNTTRCSLIDLSCLANWKRKWYSSVPVYSETNSQSARFFLCPECIPLCNYLIYNVQSSMGFIAPINFNATTYAELREIEFNRGIGILHVYFGATFVTLYHQTILHTWYELVSIYGNLVGIVIGGSIISLAELLWFISGKFSVIWWRRNKVAANDPNWVLEGNRRQSVAVEEVIKQNNQGIIYWEEFRQYVQ